MILLDTCALLWLVMEPSSLSDRAKSLIRTAEGPLLVSAISAFEIAIKSRKGKLALHCDPIEWWRMAMTHHGLTEIPITSEIALLSASFPAHHNDPADRMIIASALTIGCAVITSDSAFSAYQVSVEW